jgi:hypothetical protein
MSYETKPLLKNNLNEIIPQQYNTETNEFEPATQLQKVDVQYTKLQEQFTEADEVAGEITFSDVVNEVEIYNQDTTEATFIINNLSVRVPADTSFNAIVGGTPSATVIVSGTTKYIIGRYA